MISLLCKTKKLIVRSRSAIVCLVSYAWERCRWEDGADLWSGEANKDHYHWHGSKQQARSNDHKTICIHWLYRKQRAEISKLLLLFRAPIVMCLLFRYYIALARGSSSMRRRRRSSSSSSKCIQCLVLFCIQMVPFCVVFCPTNACLTEVASTRLPRKPILAATRNLVGVIYWTIWFTNSMWR